MGAVSDRIGRKGPLVAGFVALAIASVMFAFADGLPSLFAARLAQGAADAVTWVVGLALVADLLRPGRARARQRHRDVGRELGVRHRPLARRLDVRARRPSPAVPRRRGDVRGRRRRGDLADAAAAADARASGCRFCRCCGCRRSAPARPR